MVGFDDPDVPADFTGCSHRTHMSIINYGAAMY